MHPLQTPDHTDPQFFFHGAPSQWDDSPTGQLLQEAREQAMAGVQIATVWSSRLAVAYRSPRPSCLPCMMGENTLSSRPG